MSTTDGEPKLAYPNIVPGKLFTMVRQLAVEMERPAKRSQVEEAGLSAIIFGASAIEAFTNIYFRVAVNGDVSAAARERVLDDLKSNMGDTRRKLAEWSMLIYGRQIDKEDQRWTAYDKMIKRRNAFVHYKSEPRTKVVSPTTGDKQTLFDVSVFDVLARETPGEVVRTIVGVVELVAECSGRKGQGVKRFVNQWLRISIPLD